MALICLFMASCNSTDPKALVEKIEKDPTSLTQSDYSEMMSYMDKLLSGPAKELEKETADPNSPFLTFMMTCAAADAGFNEGYPKLDAKNKEIFKKLQKKTEEVSSNFSEMNE